MSYIDDKSIGIFANNETSLHGIFSFLNELNKAYNTRYSIKGEERTGYDTNCIDKLNDESCKKKSYWSIDKSKNITYTFDSPFFVTGYTIASGAINSERNSYPTSWIIYGRKENGILEVIDRRENQKFCVNNFCVPSIAKTYKAKYQRRAYKEIIFYHLMNSSGNDYIFLKGMEFFGILCGKDTKCIIPFKQKTCQIRREERHLQLFLVYLISM